MRILAVEDEPEYLEMLQEVMNSLGHSIVIAPNGKEGLEVLDKQTIDVVVSDVRMPGYTGLEIVERLFEGHWRVPFILMTAFGDDETRARAERVGAILLDKPLRVDELRAAVRRVVGE